ncbi:MAG: hypothetical protein JSR17_13425 [Proteobacteria bacterium]|nr:hypothetical protein [Pseudomonadota bacterium]
MLGGIGKLLFGKSTDNPTIFKEKLTEIFIGILDNTQTKEELKNLLTQANALLELIKPLDLSDFEITHQNNNYTLADLAQLVVQTPNGQLLLPQFNIWVQDGKLILSGYAPAIQADIQEAPQEELKQAQILEQRQASKKPYLAKDNAELQRILGEEFEGQDIGNASSRYAWKFKSGQRTILQNENDGDEINLFFLGTSTPPLFGIHNIDVCETGHIICQAALQKAQRGKPTLLVKGIATADMDAKFPLAALENPSIQGISTTAMEGLKKSYTTVVGTGAETRLEISMEQFFVPNLFKMLLNKPLAERDILTVNLAGHSRGGITTFLAADCIDKFIKMIATGKEGVDYDIGLIAKSCELTEEQIRKAISDLQHNQDKIKIKICALDPVEGARSMAQWDHFITWREGKYIPQIVVPVMGLKKNITCSYSQMPSRVSEACIFLANDERRSGFRPTIPTFEDATHVTYKKTHGKHGTLTGNFGNDAAQGQFHFKAFESDEKFQDAMVGIFDETLVAMNHFLTKSDELPPFPRNTLRRIFKQPEYTNTKSLLLDALISQTAELLEFDKIEEEILIKNIEVMMLQHPTLNIFFYDSLQHDAENAILNQKTKLLELEKEWRHDTNVAAAVDRDAWNKQRRLYVRGRKVGGDISWEEFNLEDLAPTRLPEKIYYDAHVRITDTKSLNPMLVALYSHFYKIKNKIDFAANSPNLSHQEKQKEIYDNEFNQFIDLLKEVGSDEKNSKIVQAMISELMIDLDGRYHLLDSKDVLERFKEVKAGIDLAQFPDLCMEIQIKSLKQFIATGIKELSLEETEALIEHIEYLQDRLPNKNPELNELTMRLTLQAELYQYITALDGYIEDKKKLTGQDTTQVEELRQHLKNILKNIDKNVRENQEWMQNLLAQYKGAKSFQGILSKWVKSEPGSIVCLNSVEEQIEKNKLKKEVKRMEDLEKEKYLNEDLAAYIKTLEDYIASFKWKTPNPDIVSLRDALKAIQTDQQKPIAQKADEMKSHIKKYVVETPYNRTHGLKQSVRNLLETTKSIQEKRLTQAKERLSEKRSIPKTTP